MEYYLEKYKIKYSDVDRNNKCKISRILDFFQDIATSHSDSLGYGSAKMLELNLGWLVTAWKFRINKLPTADERIEIRTWSRGLKGLTARRAVEILNEKKESIIQADSHWVLYNLKEKKIMKPVGEIISIYGINYKTVIEEIKHTNTKEIKGNLISEKTLKIERRDIDTNGHLNNSRYLDYALEALPDEVYNNIKIEEAELKYKKQVFENEEIIISIYQDNCNLTVILKNVNDEICAICYIKISN